MKSFVDILFILLCSTIVMLSQSIELGTVDICPAKVGGGGISEVNVDDVKLVSVSDERIVYVEEGGDEKELESLEDIALYCEKGSCLILSAMDDSVSHQRVMDVWSQLSQSGYNVKLAAREKMDDTQSGG